jgi:hypothetical protein
MGTLKKEVNRIIFVFKTLFYNSTASLPIIDVSAPLFMPTLATLVMFPCHFIP